MKLVALFDSVKFNVRVHAADCAMLNRAGWRDGALHTHKRGLVAFAWDANTRSEQELDERECKVAFCKCVPAAHRIG